MMLYNLLIFCTANLSKKNYKTANNKLIKEHFVFFFISLSIINRQPENMLK